ncbi:hypothetical protein EZV62_019528 [Acer yangbiense]|uniref:HSF-type DNA-binding domain-containing protein n=1 Tax=Acer yangbiense TaxID=1000413 RepID=A0A5C7HCT7_9ROSI|nr:hypothetical protein EZV62_019528 [Acer yangbiense]
MEACWAIMKNTAKWYHYVEGVKGQQHKGDTNNYPFDLNSENLGADECMRSPYGRPSPSSVNLSDDGSMFSQSEGLERPLGRKASKARKHKAKPYNVNLLSEDILGYEARTSSSTGGGDPATSGVSGGAPPQPVPMQNAANAPPPFLSKTYDMVDDSATDSIVSWSATNNSFVVWNPPEFARDLLPKYFKHNNFSSFVPTKWSRKGRKGKECITQVDHDLTFKVKESIQCAVCDLQIGLWKTPRSSQFDCLIKALKRRKVYCKTLAHLVMVLVYNFNHGMLVVVVDDENEEGGGGCRRGGHTRCEGFRKVDPDRWEFANEGFLRGQKHLLRGITRRKPAHGHGHQQAQQPHGQSSSVGACVEVGKFGLEEEVERLKRDKNVLMQELVRLRQQQQSTDSQLQTTVQRLQGMEQRHQQMMSFLAKAVQSPGFLAQFVQQQNDSNRHVTEANKKRRIRQEGMAGDDHSAAPDGQIVKYQPSMNGAAAKAVLRKMIKMDASSGVESFNNNHDNFLIRDGISSSNSGSSSNRVSGVTLQEVPQTSGQPSHVPAASGIPGHGPSAAVSEIQSSAQVTSCEKIATDQFSDISALVGAQEAPSIPISQADVIMPELSQIPEIVPESIVDIPGENYMSRMGNGEYTMPIGIDDISPDPDIDALLENSGFWDDFLVQSPVPEDIESTSVDVQTMGNEMQPMENGWDKVQHLDQLTEQMGLLNNANRKEV